MSVQLFMLLLLTNTDCILWLGRTNHSKTEHGGIVNPGGGREDTTTIMTEG